MNKEQNPDNPQHQQLYIADVSGSALIEWQYLHVNGHYGYWKEKSKKTMFEKNEMTVTSTKFLNSGELP